MPELPQPKSEPSPTLSEARTRCAWPLRFSTVELLIALVLLFFIAPLVESLKAGEAIESGLVTLVLVVAVLAVGGRRRTLAIAILLAVPAVVGKWANHLWPHLVPEALYRVAAAVFLIFVVMNLLWFILRAPRVNLEVLCAGISGYLLLGLLWAFAYMMVATHVPNSFAYNGATSPNPVLDNFSAFYFSFTTLSTTGFGDFTPVARVARMLAVMEAITGTFYLAVLISRLVAMYSSQPPAETNAPGSP